jgi:hypothetical protein
MRMERSGTGSRGVYSPLPLRRSWLTVGGSTVVVCGDCCYTMCMHSNRRSVDTLIDSIAQMDEQELDRMQSAIDRRRGSLKKKQSIVVERREHRNGVLQLEGRAYRRKKDGELTERGPYWYFHYREGGKQRTLYVGKTDNPETVVDERLGKE